MDPSATRQEVPDLVADAQSFAERGKVLDALQIYQAAERLDPTLDVSAVEWNNLCWYGTLWGFAAKVLRPACEKAVELDSANGEIRDSRGVARAVTGDFTGAIEDFRYRQLSRRAVESTGRGDGLSGGSGGSGGGVHATTVSRTPSTSLAPIASA
jgi:hypothetical protein